MDSVGRRSFHRRRVPPAVAAWGATPPAVDSASIPDSDGESQKDGMTKRCPWAPAGLPHLSVISFVCLPKMNRRWTPAAVCAARWLTWPPSVPRIFAGSQSRESQKDVRLVSRNRVVTGMAGLDPTRLRLRAFEHGPRKNVGRRCPGPIRVFRSGLQGELAAEWGQTNSGCADDGQAPILASQGQHDSCSGTWHAPRFSSTAAPIAEAAGRSVRPTGSRPAGAGDQTPIRTNPGPAARRPWPWP